MPKKWLWCIPAAILLIAGVIYAVALLPTEQGALFSEPETTPVSSCASLEGEAEQTEYIYVHVCGAVREPGVYALPKGARGTDALEAAGGFTAAADVSYVNLAKVLEDGEQLYFPTVSEAESLRSAEAAAGLININPAGKEQLMTLPGIGDNKAEAIIAYRKSHGAFASTEDIMQVAGIKEAAYEKIKDLITV